MKHTAFLLITAIIINGCELVVLQNGSRKQIQPVELSQSNAIGTVMIFKMLLDSCDYANAAYLVAGRNGERLPAEERFEMAEEMARVGRILGNSAVTATKTDTVSATVFVVTAELDMVRYASFELRQTKDKWFITSYKFSAAKPRYVVN